MYSSYRPANPQGTWVMKASDSHCPGVRGLRRMESIYWTYIIYTKRQKVLLIAREKLLREKITITEI